MVEGRLVASPYLKALKKVEAVMEVLSPAHRAHMLRYLESVYIYEALEPPDEREAARRRQERRRTNHATNDVTGDVTSHVTKPRESGVTKPGTAEVVTSLLGDYEKYFQERYGARPNLSRPKDPVLVTRLVRQYGPDKVADLLRLFFETEDEFVRKSGHGIGVFSSQINKLLALQAGPKLVQADAAAKRARAMVGLLDIR